MKRRGRVSCAGKDGLSRQKMRSEIRRPKILWGSRSNLTLSFVIRRRQSNAGSLGGSANEQKNNCHSERSEDTERKRQGCASSWIRSHVRATSHWILHCVQ